MRSTTQNARNKSRNRGMRSPMVFRFRREPPTPMGRVSPFTEMPEELKRGRFSLGRAVRKVFNFMLLLVLGLALAGLVLAFAYQMMHNPESVEAWGNTMIRQAELLFHSIAGAIHL